MIRTAENGKIAIDDGDLSCKTHHKGKSPVEGEMVEDVAEADVEDHQQEGGLEIGFEVHF